MTASSDSSSYWVRSSIGHAYGQPPQLGEFECAQILSGAERDRSRRHLVAIAGKIGPYPETTLRIRQISRHVIT